MRDIEGVAEGMEALNIGDDCAVRAFSELWGGTTVGNASKQAIPNICDATSALEKECISLAC